MIKKRFLCLLCAAVLVFSAVGCSGADPADTEAVMAALDKFAACESFTVVQTTEFQEVIVEDKEKQVYNCRNEKEIHLLTGPDAQMLTSNVDSIEFEGEVMSQTTISYILPENGGYAEYVNSGDEWYKAASEDGTALEGIGAEFIIGSFYADMLSYRKAGEESLDSGKAIRYEGMLGGDDLLTMLAVSGHLNSVASMSASQQEKIMANLADDLKAIPVSVWVDAVSGYPVRFQVSIAETLMAVDKSINKTLGNKSSDTQWSLTDYTISMSVMNFNAVEEIVLPEAAASAKPVETAEAAE